MPIPGADSPATQVLLDDASGGGTWPYDITAYVELQYGYSITRGRSDEVGDVQPSTLGMTLNNSDGRFTLGTTGGGYGTINTDRRIQVKHTVSGVTTTRCTLYVQDWPVEWPGGSPGYAVATINAVDRLTRLNRRVLRSMIEQEILLDGPVAYYTLGEPAGSTSAANSAGSSVANLVSTGSGAVVVFGNATGPGTDGLTAATFAGGKWLTDSNSGGPLSWECFFSTTSTPAAVMALIVANDANSPTGIGIDATGKLCSLGLGGAGAGVGSVVTDGATHHLAWAFTNLYLDGALISSSVNFPTGGFHLIGGAGSVLASATSATGFVGVIAHVASYGGTLSSTRVAAHANAGLNGFAGEASDQRVSRLALYANIPTSDQTLETGVQTNVPHFDITGMSPTAAMQDVVNSEDGLLFLRGDGKLVFQNRTHRAAQVAPDLTITADAMGPGDRFSGDMQRIVNAATVTRAGGAGGYAENAVSIAAHEQYPTSMDLKVATDDEARDRASWEANAYPESLPRLGGLTLDLLSQTVAIQQGAQALELSDRIQITGLPSQALSGTTTADLIVEGWTESVSSTAWTMQLNASPWAPNAVWVLEDPVYGQYDAYPLSF